MSTFNKFIDTILQLCEKRKWGQLALTLILSGICLSVMVLLSVWVIEGITSFISKNFDAIMAALFICFLLIYGIWSKLDERKTAQVHLAEQRTMAAAELERAIAENTYIIVRQCIFSVLLEKANAIGLIKPVSLSDLDSPARLIDRNGFVLCQYIAMKQSEFVETALIAEYLQNRVTQRLNNGEFSEIPSRSFVYEGRAYPAVYIDSVADAGAYIQINAVLVNDAYCRHLQNRQFAKTNNLGILPAPRDSDF